MDTTCEKNVKYSHLAEKETEGVIERPSNPKRGIVYTRKETVRFLLNVCEFPQEFPLESTRVLDVCCGTGQFLLEIARRICHYGIENGLLPDSIRSLLSSNLRGVEIDLDSAALARKSLHELLSYKLGDHPDNRTLVNEIVIKEDFLRWGNDCQFELVVGNLPYIKYNAIEEAIPGTHLDWLRREYSTFRGRADYSVACFQKALGHLTTKGIAGILTSNRFTKSDYGTELRRLLANGYSVIAEYDVSDALPFTSNVSAYASIFVITLSKRRERSRFIKINSIPCTNRTSVSDADINEDQELGWSCSRLISVYGDVWSRQTLQINAVCSRLLAGYKGIEELGYSIRKGIATGANDVFIGTRTYFETHGIISVDYLLPIITSGMIAVPDTDLLFLSPYSKETGKLIPFETLPLDISEYLASRRRKLEQRYMVRCKHREWWATIDNFHPRLLGPKVLVADFKGVSRSVHDSEGQGYPGHGIWSISKPGVNLDAIFGWIRCPVSSLFEIYLSPTMNGGAPRISSRMLRSIPAPRTDEDLHLFSSLDPYEAARIVFQLTSSEIIAIQEAINHCH